MSFTYYHSCVCVVCVRVCVSMCLNAIMIQLTRKKTKDWAA